MEVIIDSFEETYKGEDTHHYSWYEYVPDTNVPENVVTELKENILDFSYVVRQNNKLYKIKHKGYPGDLNDEQKKVHFLRNFAIESAESKHQYIKELLIESKPIIDSIKKLAETHEPVIWENLPLSSNYDSTFTDEKISKELINFRIAKLWIEFEKDHFKVGILTSPPRYRDIIQRCTIGKLYVSQNGKKLVSYCGHCDNMKFT